MAIKVLIRDARAAFVELGAADYFQGRKQRENDKRRRSTTFLCGPTTQAKIDGVGNWGPAKIVIDQAIQLAAQEKWQAKATNYLAAILPDPKACAFQDGARKPDYDGFPGNWALTAHRTEDKGRPLVLDADKAHLYGHQLPDGTWQMTDTPVPGKEGRIYSGCYVNGSVDLWCQDNPSGKGIRAELLGVQFARTGDAFGSGRVADPGDFESLATGADADALA
jgi:hypothetical protein